MGGGRGGIGNLDRGSVASEKVEMAVKADKLDLSFLNGEETRAVLKVLERDRRLKMRDAERVG